MLIALFIFLSKESLSREKCLEDILVRVKAMIHKNIGRSDVDLMKTFEDVKHILFIGAIKLSYCEEYKNQ